MRGGSPDDKEFQRDLSLWREREGRALARLCFPCARAEPSQGFVSVREGRALARLCSPCARAEPSQGLFRRSGNFSFSRAKRSAGNPRSVFYCIRQAAAGHQARRGTMRRRHTPEKAYFSAANGETNLRRRTPCRPCAERRTSSLAASRQAVKAYCKSVS